MELLCAVSSGSNHHTVPQKDPQVPVKGSVFLTKEKKILVRESPTRPHRCQLRFYRLAHRKPTCANYTPLLYTWMLSSPTRPEEHPPKNVDGSLWTCSAL